MAQTTFTPLTVIFRVILGIENRVLQSKNKRQGVSPAFGYNFPHAVNVIKNLMTFLCKKKVAA